MAKYLQDERRGDVLRLTLNRPEIHNAFDEEMIAEVTAAFAAAAKDAALRAVVVRGAGKHFCAGADIQWMRRAGGFTQAKNVQDAARLNAMYRAVDECPIPVIARVHGACYGGGLGIVAAADVAVGSPDVKMSFSECRLGILPAVISSFAMPKIGIANARRYFLTAEVFGAETARQIGLLSEVRPEAELDAAVEEILQSILKCGPNAVREAKDLIRKTAAMPREKHFAYTPKTLARVRATAEAKEGLSAFLEKRAADWARSE